jgi:predicted RNase H-like HicB family nuclease
MRKAKPNATDDPRPEYERSDFGKMVRGKYAARLAEETNVVVLEPEVAKVKAEEWPEDFWRAFEGMPDDFERPPQIRQTRESFPVSPKEGFCYHIHADWDPEAGVWVATSHDVPGLATEASTLEALAEKLRTMIPELLEANQLLSNGQGDAIAFELTSRRREWVRLVS